MSSSSAVDSVWDYSVSLGVSWTETGTVFDDGTTPLDITDATITVVVKDQPDSSGDQVGTVAASVLVGASGTFSVGQTVAQVAEVGAGSWWWSATLTLDGAEPVHLWHGKFDVLDVVEA